MALVLCTGVNPTLRETRRLILEQAGHTVVSIADERGLVAACQKHNFDVAVIGQAVSPNVKKVIAALIREHCSSVLILDSIPPIFQGPWMMPTHGWKSQSRFLLNWRSM